ncbi:DUF1285 domain-containing protein [Thalassolituus sp. LLYu03]|uniref:DUF1285 domain-containing protein n=1 Tax=Thalassolituus sp. LLYu03 TaxID=3421656 RepID=UPI003D2B6639
MDLTIRKDGTWWHEGSKFEREKLVRLFASILKREGDDYFLVTPVEKWRIKVEDRPLHVLMIERTGDDLQALTSGGDLITLGQAHPLKISPLDDADIPEVLVRGNLWARFTRNAYYQLTDLATITDSGDVFVESSGERFSLI